MILENFIVFKEKTFFKCYFLDAFEEKTANNLKKDVSINYFPH